jgi:hypothetical protein
MRSSPIEKFCRFAKFPSLIEARAAATHAVQQPGAEAAGAGTWQKITLKHP